MERLVKIQVCISGVMFSINMINKKGDGEGSTHNPGGSFLLVWYIIETGSLFQKDKNKNKKNETLNRK